MYKTGLGYDVHAFVEGRKLILGGVEIPYARGLAGHSDADVLVHAICDALLGAVGEGDIGEHFPNTDNAFKNISSLKLLALVKALLDRNGYGVENVDTVVIAEEPNIKVYKPKMRECLAKILGIDPGCVNIKATTNEGLGFLGNKEGIVAASTVLLKKKERKGLCQ